MTRFFPLAMPKDWVESNFPLPPLLADSWIFSYEISVEVARVKVKDVSHVGEGSVSSAIHLTS